MNWWGRRFRLRALGYRGQLEQPPKTHCRLPASGAALTRQRLPTARHAGDSKIKRCLAGGLHGGLYPTWDKRQRGRSMSLCRAPLCPAPLASSGGYRLTNTRPTGAIPVYHSGRSLPGTHRGSERRARQCVDGVEAADQPSAQPTTSSVIVVGSLACNGPRSLQCLRRDSTERQHRHKACTNANRVASITASGAPKCRATKVAERRPCTAFSASGFPRLRASKRPPDLAAVASRGRVTILSLQFWPRRSAVAD